MTESRPIETLELSCRAYNALRNFGIETIEQLIAFTPRQIFQLKNCGGFTVTEIRDALAKIGIKWEATCHTCGAKTGKWPYA